MVGANSVADRVVSFIAYHSGLILWTDLGHAPKSFHDIILSNFFGCVHARSFNCLIECIGLQKKKKSGRSSTGSTGLKWTEVGAIQQSWNGWNKAWNMRDLLN